MWPIQLAFRFHISRRIFLCSLTQVTLLHFSHDRSNWSSPSFSSTTFQNLPGISDLLPEASKFQHHTKPCSKCNILLVSSSNLRTGYYGMINRKVCGPRLRPHKIRQGKALQDRRDSAWLIETRITDFSSGDQTESDKCFLALTKAWRIVRHFVSVSGQSGALILGYVGHLPW